MYNLLFTCTLENIQNMILDKSTLWSTASNTVDGARKNKSYWLSLINCHRITIFGPNDRCVTAVTTFICRL